MMLKKCYFLDILDLNKFDVFGDHINKARQEKLRLPTRTPDEEDLSRLRKYTVECLNSLSDIYTHIGLHECVQLRHALCSRITLFNARRGGEPSRMTVSQWNDRSKWLDKEAVSRLDECDQQLFSSMAVMYQTGKGNHLVPCLVQQDCVRCLDILVNENIRRYMLVYHNITITCFQIHHYHHCMCLVGIVRSTSAMLPTLIIL